MFRRRFFRKDVVGLRPPLRRLTSAPTKIHGSIGAELWGAVKKIKEISTRGRQLNKGTEGGRRACDIPTIGLFTLITSSGLIGVPLFGYGYTKLDWVLAEILYLISLISGLGTVGYQLTGSTSRLRV